MHFIDGEFQIGCFTDKTFRSANNTRASKKEQTSDKHVKESSARMNKAFIVRTASWAKLLHGHGKSLRVWRNFLFCLKVSSHDIKATFETCPGERTSNSLPLPVSTGLGGVSPVGKPCLAGVAPPLPSPFIVTAAAAGSHTAGTTLNPGLESAQSPLCLPIGGGGCTQLETGGRFGWSFFVRSEDGKETRINGFTGRR